MIENRYKIHDVSWLADSLAGVGPLKPEHEKCIINRKGGLDCTGARIVRDHYVKTTWVLGTVSPSTGWSSKYDHN